MFNYLRAFVHKQRGICREKFNLNRRSLAVFIGHQYYYFGATVIGIQQSIRRHDDRILDCLVNSRQ